MIKKRKEKGTSIVGTLLLIIFVISNCLGSIMEKFVLEKFTNNFSSYKEGENFSFISWK